MIHPRILMAGIGNIFLGDDAFGVEVVQRLAGRKLPEAVRVVDFGIRGFDLACALMEGYETVILVDAAPRGESPGTLYVIEPDTQQFETAVATDGVEVHSLDPAKVLRLVSAMGGRVSRLLVVGCEPQPLNPADDFQMGVSPAMAAAIEPATDMVQSLVADILSSSHTADRIAGADVIQTQ